MLRGIVETFRAKAGKELPTPRSEDEARRHKKLSSDLAIIARNTTYLSDDLLSGVEAYSSVERPEEGLAADEQRPVELGKNERELLRILIFNNGKAMTAKEILNSGFRPELKIASRRRIIPEAAQSLEQLLLDQHGISAITTTGSTRARSYLLQSNAHIDIRPEMPGV